MLRFGSEPFLECSSKGDKRFSAFYARIKRRNNETIEVLYQKYKLFDGYVQGLSVKEAKGRKALNQEHAAQFYRLLWQEYFQENPDLLDVISRYGGFSDIFGQAGHVCQAEEIWKIKNRLL